MHPENWQHVELSSKLRTNAVFFLSLQELQNENFEVFGGKLDGHSKYETDSIGQHHRGNKVIRLNNKEKNFSKIR